MSGRTEQLALRRAALIARSAALRADIGAYGAMIGERLGLVDRGLQFAKSVTQRPMLMAAATALFMFFRPTTALKWMGRGAVATSLIRRILSIANVGRTPRG